MTTSRPLTERELAVLDGMSWGKGNREIGLELYLTEDTVKTHVRKVFRKLGARDRAHAVRIGFERGYLSSAAPEPPPDVEPVLDEPPAPRAEPEPQDVLRSERCDGANVEEFYLIDHERAGSYLPRLRHTAVTYCEPCPLRGDCWSRAYASNELGVWGGSLHREGREPLDLLPPDAWRTVA